MNPTPTDPREGKPPFVMPLIHGLNCEKVCHERANGYLHAPDDDGPYDVDGLKYCGRCHTWLPETPEQLQSTNSKLAAEIAELKAELEHYGSVAEWMGKPTSDLHTELIRLRAELEAARKELSTIAAIVSPAALDVGKNNEVLYAVERYAAEALQTERVRDSLKLSVEILRKNRDEWEKSWGQVVRQRDTALAAKDAAEKALQRISDWCECAMTDIVVTPKVAEAFEQIKDEADAALTPAPTQEPPAGGVTISNDSSLPKAGNNAETREGIVPAPSDGKCDSAAIVLLPRDDREQVGQATPDVRPVPAVTISTEKKGGDELCATNTKTDSAPVTPSNPDRVTQTVHSTVACESPADVPSVGRGEPDHEDGCDHEGFKGGCERQGHAPETCPHKLLPFNLSDALAGKPVVTRDRWKASNIQGDKLLGGIVNGIYYNWYLDGKCTNGNPLHDLFMLPTEGSGA